MRYNFICQGQNQDEFCKGRSIEMKKLILALLALRIEFIWRLIVKERKKGQRLLRTGHTYSSPQLIRLNHYYSRHCVQAMAAQSAYEHLSGTGIRRGDHIDLRKQAAS
jgi:hypothetical protein